jgi:predicted dehydrogenase
MNGRFSRRYFFLGGAALAAASGLGARTVSLKRAGYKSPNEKLNIGGIGVGGKGYGDINSCATENIVALCDADVARAAKTFARYPKATRYKDFRRMLEKEKSLDAVVVSTPDHVHAIASAWAIQRGLHVYVQKPMTRTIWEARRLTELARKHKVATQMGNQGHSNEGTRQLCEMIWAGEIGAVREVHAWSDRPIWPQGIPAPLAEEPVPSTLDWDVWLGPAEKRPFNKGYVPFKWRGWFDFGCGALGDMACHILDPANWALRLGAPSSVECVKLEKKNSQTFPTRSVLRFEFPARANMPPVTLYWYDGGLMPPRPTGIAPGVNLGEGGNGSLFIGDKGIITTGAYGEKSRLLPDEKMRGYRFPDPFLTRSPGHYRDWIRAAKGGEKACSNFDYAGPFTEWVLLGTLAVRFEGKLEWDSRRMKVTNVAEANLLIQPRYRKGWKI